MAKNVNEDVKNLKFINQIGIAVKDAQATADMLKTLFGIKMSVILIPPSKAVLRGKEIEFQIKVGLARVGNVDLELIEVVSGEHVIKEYFDKHGMGVHHLGIYVDSLDKAIEQWESAGGKLVQRNLHAVGVKSAYIDVQHQIGNVYIELIQMG